MAVMNQREVVQLLKAKQGDQTLTQFAESLGISISYLSDIFNLKRNPGHKVLSFLGLSKRTVKETTYRPARKQKQSA